MAGTLNFKFVANDTGLKKGIADAKGNLTGFESATKNVSANIRKALGAISFVAVVKGLTDAAKAAAADQIAQDKLALQLRTSTNASDAQIASVEKNILAMSRQTGIADDVLRPALANAARSTGDMQRAQELLTIGLDVAAATGKPLETVMNALAKAENGNTTALYKLAPELKKTKGGVDDLAASVKGAAEVSANPFDKFKVSLDEAKEVIGAAFLPVLEKLIAALSPIIEKIAPVLARLIEALAPIFLQLVEALLPLVEKLLPPLVELLTALMPVLLPIIQILTDLLVPIIKIVVAVFKAWLGYFTPIIKGVGILVGALKTGFSGIGSFFKGLINGWIGMVEGFINFFIDGINMIPKAINKIKFKVPDWVPFIGGKTVGFNLPTFGKVKIPRLANGGVVMPRPGGVLANIAEAGKPEAVIPLDRMGNMGGNTYHIHINKASITGQEIVQAIQRYQTGQGRVILNG